MNSIEYWETYSSQKENTHEKKEYFQVGWVACKNEIINLIQKDGMRMINSYDIIELIKKENL